MEIAQLLQAADGSKPPTDLASLLQLFMINHSAAELLDAVRVDEKALSLNAANSFRHKNGFLRLTLGMLRDNGPRLRLHIWQAQDETAEIHNHTWHFASMIIRGTLFEECFELDRNSHPNLTILQIPSKDGVLNGLHFQTIGKSALRQISSEVRAEGDIYERNCNIFHRISATTYPTISLVLQGNHQRQLSCVARTGNIGRVPKIEYLGVDDFYHHVLAAKRSLTSSR